MPNRLSDAISPYLLQHADNPVEWHPWDAPALELARRLERPILLSIGYSACHWCHVMAHESFEDADTAALMNAHFVNVKVDREERPDLDRIYQDAHALLNGRGGGWPLTVFLTPEQEPFWCGTYLPPEPRHGLPAFRTLLRAVADAWRDRQPEVRQTAVAVRAALVASAAREAEPESSDTVGIPAAGDTDAAADVAGARALTDAALSAIAQQYDPVHGGLGRAPKFYHPTQLRLCLEEGELRDDPALERIALHTLARVCAGGTFDHLGGGFFRYSVDAGWSIPHFEKMLYDNGTLLGLCADAWRRAGDAGIERALRMTAGWLEREMRGADGGFAASLDADSPDEHGAVEEGAFYLWRREALDEVLPDPMRALFARRYGLDSAPNFEHRAWHLQVRHDEVLAPEDERMLAEAGQRMAAERERRVRPARDDKRLAGWNALAAAGLARASRTLDEPHWARLACDAADFARRDLFREGRLHAVARDGQARLPAWLDDHAQWIAALIELMQVRFRGEDARFAAALADELLAGFEDRERGGFFFTRHDHEPLIQRPKPLHDDVTASGNGAAADALLTLGFLLGRGDWIASAQRTLAWMLARGREYPMGIASALRARALLDAPPAVVVLTGPPPQTADWARSLRARLRPRQMLIDLGDARDVPDGLAKPLEPRPLAWICEGLACRAPLARLDDALAALGPVR